ncbi:MULTISPECIES: YitT family protein [unclassified Symbiopectobacterium]|uniref:membrane protein YczE n=1 Tax=unclassified Symbiopectobacterium TaxID=2794573 RepID=UPI002227962D|nr:MULTISPECIES: hypothetical protein [unclassified Symbiopectobacterium]MCW2474117.1 hypothetical protein [Candidatus Symbiopectobacterium sp. NZEC151]MCW2485356.1 hypothetical protein [Candidatus Symbiopectobacterium sp. NZEC127]
MAYRLGLLYVGLALYGMAIAMMIRGNLGVDPWDVFHLGLAQHLPLSVGTIIILIGALVLLLWIPLRQRPGLGTISNVVVIGLATNVGLDLLPEFEHLGARTALLVGGVITNGLATGMYIGAGFGPGPRDGLMTGIVARTGWQIRYVRTGIELTVLVVGWILGGTVGVGTVVYAFAIGPLIQLFLPYFVGQSRERALQPKASS